MKTFSTSHDFNYNWDEVSTANWQKYCPWNKESGHVLSVDTLSRTLDKETGVLRTERLITCKQSAPKWLAPFLGGNELSHVYEVSYVTPPERSPEIMKTGPSSQAKAATSIPTTAFNSSFPGTPTERQMSRDQPKPRTVVMHSVNITFANLLTVHETVTYAPSPLDPANKTRFEQSASIRALCSSWKKVRDRIEDFSIERFGQNAARGRQGFEEVLEMSRKVRGETPPQSGSGGSGGKRESRVSGTNLADGAIGRPAATLRVRARSPSPSRGQEIWA